MSVDASTLEREKQVLISLANSFGKDQLWLEGGHGDNVSLWNGIGVTEGRVTRLDWYAEDLHGPIPSIIGYVS